MLDRGTVEKDLFNVRGQIANIEKELTKVDLMHENLTRLRGVASYLESKELAGEELAGEENSETTTEEI